MWNIKLKFYFDIFDIRVFFQVSIYRPSLLKDLYNGCTDSILNCNLVECIVHLCSDYLQETRNACEHISFVNSWSVWCTHEWLLSRNACEHSKLVECIVCSWSTHVKWILYSNNPYASMHMLKLCAKLNYSTKIYKSHEYLVKTREFSAHKCQVKIELYRMLSPLTPAFVSMKSLVLVKW